MATAVLVFGCDKAAPDSRAATPEHVDSALSREESLRRFRTGLTEVGALSGGASSPDALARAFITAVAANDTAALRTLAVTKTEFAYLIYPTDPQGLPPYNLAPGLRWFMLASRSGQGLSAALHSLGGHQLNYLGLRCTGDSSSQGQNVLWGPCFVRFVQTPGDTTEQRLFGPIIRRGHQYKLVSLANSL